MLEPPEHAKEGDPQCTFMIPNKGQCPYIAVGGDKCPMHGGAFTLKALAKKESMYRLHQQYRERIDGLTGHKDHFSLNEELGVLRMLLEGVLNQFDGDTNKMLRASGQISELVARIEKVVGSAMKAEKYVGGLMSRSQAIQMLQDAVDAIAEEINDPDIISAVAMKLEAIARKNYEDQDD